MRLFRGKPFACLWSSSTPKSKAGRKPIDRLMLFKMLILQQLSEWCTTWAMTSWNIKLTTEDPSGSFWDSHLSPKSLTRSHNRPLSPVEQATWTRYKVEHVFGSWVNCMGGKMVRFLEVPLKEKFSFTRFWWINPTGSGSDSSNFPIFRGNLKMKINQRR